jgi:hypothetical protein
MANSNDDVLVFFALLGFVTMCSYFLSYIIGITFLIMLGIFVAFCFMLFVGFIGVVGAVGAVAVTEGSRVNREVDRAVRRNGGNIDGAKMKFGDAEVYVEGPRNSFGKAMKYIFTGKEDYSTKFRIGGYEVGKIKTSSDGTFKFKWNG